MRSTVNKIWVYLEQSVILVPKLGLAGTQPYLGRRVHPGYTHQRITPKILNCSLEGFRALAQVALESWGQILSKLQNK